jgi:hypothetical protein
VSFVKLLSRTAIQLANNPSDSIPGIVNPRTSNREMAPFGLEVADVVPVVAVPVERGLGTGVDGL